MIIALLSEIWYLLQQMAPYLLFGYSIAGILRISVPRDKIYSHLADNNFRSVVKASILGVPLPLCSCGVIPVAAHLRKEGAGEGPTLSRVPVCSLHVQAISNSFTGPRPMSTATTHGSVGDSEEAASLE